MVITWEQSQSEPLGRKLKKKKKKRGKGKVTLVQTEENLLERAGSLAGINADLRVRRGG